MLRLTSLLRASARMAGRRAALHVLVLIAVAVLLLTAATGSAQAAESVRVEVQVWQHPANPGDIRVGALPADGSWPAPEMIALMLDDGISSSGRYRYGDISIEVQWRIGAVPVTVEVRVWQHVKDERDIHISARGSLGSWRTLGTVPLALDHGHGPEGRFRAGGITITAPLPDGESGAPLRYRFDPAGEATEPGSHAFLTAPVASAITTYEGFRRDAATLRVSAVAADGASSDGLFGEVEAGHLIEWYWRYDCFVRYRVTAVAEAGAGAAYREFGVRPETYVFQGCQSGSLPADGSTAVFSTAPELPLQHLGGTGLASFAVVHGPWQLVPGTQPAVLAAPEPSDANLATCVSEGAVPDPAVQPGLVRDCAVLLDALDALLGDVGLANWSAGHPIAEWDGVVVEGSPPRVVELWALSGGPAVAGRLPPVLGQLSALEVLDLSGEDLTGEIPAVLGLLADLYWLDLGGNQLSGKIPPELGQLSNLMRLALAESQLSGKIPPELGQLSNLVYLALRGNPLTGEIPPELGQLADLRELHLGDTRLSGEIPPELGQLSELEALDLWVWGDGFTGVFPIELGRLTKLTYFRLRPGNMTGCIPPSLAPFARYWDLPFCRESAAELALPPPDPVLVEACSSGGAVADPKGQPGLVEDCAVLLEAKPILAPDESLLNWSADLPIELWMGITVAGSPRRVTEIGLSSEDLGGQMPAGLARLSHLRELWLSGNGLTGPIPPELGQLWNLKDLWLYDNRLTGEIPPALADLRFVNRLWLSGNELTGPIPAALGSMSSLTNLELSDNRLSGPIPIELANLTKLEYLELRGNQLTGVIPPQLFSIRGLVELDLRDNLLTGSLPPQLATFRGGWGLRLGGNSLTGCLPLAARDVIADYDDLALRYCECPALLSSGASPDLGVGADGIPFMPHEATAVAGTYRVTFALVLELPDGGEFSLGVKERDDASRIIVTITEELSRSRLVIDPFTGEELARSVVEGPPGCDVSVRDLFDAIVASARPQPLAPPATPDGVRGLYFLQPAEGGRAYRLGDFVLDVPAGLRITFDGYGGVCYDPGGCYTTLTLRDEDSASALTLDAATGQELSRHVREAGAGRGAGALFDRLVGSIRRDEPPSCERAATAPDCAVLLDIRATLAGRGDPPNWSAETPLTAWEGVGINRFTGRVVQLEWNGDGVSSRIPAALARLSALELLDLSDMTGTIPEELGQLAQLRVLELEWNDLTGGIPPDLGQLSNLWVLDLSSAGLSGEIPPQLGSLANLRQLDLSWNDLSGSVPPELGRLSNLRLLDLSASKIGGEFPTALLDLTNLQELRLGGLTGELPPEIGSLSKLQVLDLYGHIESAIPPEIGSLRNLRTLYLDSPFASGIPPELGSLRNLEELLLGYTLGGSIPPELGRLSRLRRLSLDGNRLTGEIPPELGALWSLATLGLGDNQLTGEIPPALGTLWNLTALDLTDNQLTGEIPPELGGLGGLEFILLARNQLTGEIPQEWGALPGLEVVDLSGNRLDGCIPPALEKFVLPGPDSNPGLMVCPRGQ